MWRTKTRSKNFSENEVSSSVRWEQSIRKMIEEGVDTFVEIGPGKTLAGFMRKISRDVPCTTLVHGKMWTKWQRR